MCLQGKDSNEEERGLGIDFIHKSNKKKKKCLYGAIFFIPGGGEIRAVSAWWDVLR